MITDEAMDAAVAEYRSFRNADEFYNRLDASSEFTAALEAAYVRGITDPTKNFLLYDAGGWYPAQVSVVVAWPDTSGSPPENPPDKPLTGTELIHELARQIVALGDRMPTVDVPAASAFMAPPNIPQGWAPSCWADSGHSGIDKYSDESHVGRVEAASGKREDNFRVWRKPATLE